jgi:ketosteroid isomerase-like protein
MRKSAVTTLVTAALVIVAFNGCQSTPKGPSDEEQIATMVANWRAAFEAKDVDETMAAYSEDYSDPDTPDKATIRTRIEQAISMGYLDGLVVDTADAQTKVDENTATVTPVTIKAPMFSMTFALHLAKEDSGWLIVSATSQQ